MSLLPVTLAAGDYDRTRALRDGRVRVEGIDLNYVPLLMPESAFRMQHYGEFDASEMSLSWYVRRISDGDSPYTAIPVYPSRMFRHSSIYVNVDSGIESPSDLVGKKVGCPEYQMTAAVWCKGILADFHGVPVDSVEYYSGGLEQAGRRERAMQLPENIHVHSIEEGKTLSRMLADGEIDAIYTAHQPSTFTTEPHRVRHLFEDFETAERAYFAETGIFPVMHVIVISNALLEQSPWVARSLMKGFEDSKQLTYQDLAETTALTVTLPWVMKAYEDAVETFGTTDFWSYGLDGNREGLDTFLRYSFEQGLSRRKIAVEELFVPSTLRVSKI
jgi:4,5-dihydroxyphthalate decarboxylase